MRNWTWLVLVASSGLAWACGGDDDGGNDDDDGTGGTSTTTGSGGTGGDSGGTGGASGGTGGASGGTGGGTSTGNNTTGTGGGSTTGTGGATTGTGGSAGADAGGAAGDAGAAGADTGSGGTGGGDPPTIEEACAASCAAQVDTGCADPGCDYNCVYAAGIFAACAEEYTAQQACYGDLDPSDFYCMDDYPVTAGCPDADAAFGECMASLP